MEKPKKKTTKTSKKTTPVATDPAVSTNVPEKPDFQELALAPAPPPPDHTGETNGPGKDPTAEEIGSEANNKKRGRKPRGGKLILRSNEPTISPPVVSNIILHLKCSLRDLNEYNTKMSRLMTDPLEYNPDVPPEVLTYNDNSPKGFTSFDDIETSLPPHSGSMANPPPSDRNTLYSGGRQLCRECAENAVEELPELSRQFDTDELSNNVNMKDMNAKLKWLKVQLYKNAIQLDKKAACFWCTYDFDNTPCHIPKYEMDETIYGYGSFCRPECAVAYLMKENIDDSTKFERYQLLNQIYSKVYGCKKNIKPAPNPYYLLEKYYGNLTIQEYRKLLKTEHLLLTIDKPLTRILPELHEDNEDMIMNIYGIHKNTESISGVYKVKRHSEKQQGPSKTSIIRNKFGLG